MKEKQATWPSQNIFQEKRTSLFALVSNELFFYHILFALQRFTSYQRERGWGWHIHHFVARHSIISFRLQFILYLVYCTQYNVVFVVSTNAISNKIRISYWNWLILQMCLCVCMCGCQDYSICLRVNEIGNICTTFPIHPSIYVLMFACSSILFSFFLFYFFWFFYYFSSKSIAF